MINDFVQTRQLYFKTRYGPRFLFDQSEKK